MMSDCQSFLGLAVLYCKTRYRLDDKTKLEFVLDEQVWASAVVIA